MEEAQAPQPVAAAGADAIPSPMPGTILKVLVAVGDQVTENQPLLILEAMKMENEIVQFHQQEPLQLSTSVQVKWSILVMVSLQLVNSTITRINRQKRK